VRDLFEDNDRGGLDDVAFLDKLVIEKLTARGEDNRRRRLEVDRGQCRSALRPRPAAAPARRHASRSYRRGAVGDRGTAEHAKLEADYQDADELPQEVDARLGEIETALAGFEDRPVNYDPADIARDGSPSIAAKSGRRTNCRRFPSRR
jgi:ParB family chromosome partitioning protein